MAQLIEHASYRQPSDAVLGHALRQPSHCAQKDLPFDHQTASFVDERHSYIKAQQLLLDMQVQASWQFQPLLLRQKPALQKANLGEDF